MWLGDRVLSRGYVDALIDITRQADWGSVEEFDDRHIAILFQAVDEWGIKVEEAILHCSNGVWAR